MAALLIPLALIIQAVALLVHERVDDCPVLIVAGVAVNVATKGTGGAGGGLIVLDTGAVHEPARQV